MIGRSTRPADADLDFFVGDVFPDMCLTAYGVFQISHLLAILVMPIVCIVGGMIGFQLRRPQLHLLLQMPLVSLVPAAWNNRSEGAVVILAIVACSILGTMTNLIPLAVGAAARNYAPQVLRTVFPMNPAASVLRSNTFGISRSFTHMRLDSTSGVPTAQAISGQPAASLGLVIQEGSWFNGSDWKSTNAQWDYFPSTDAAPSLLLDVAGSKFLDYIEVNGNHDNGTFPLQYRIPFCPWQQGSYALSYVLTSVVPDGASIACDVSVVASFNVRAIAEGPAPVSTTSVYVQSVWRPYPGVFVAAVTAIELIQDDGSGFLNFVTHRKLFSNAVNDPRITLDAFDSYRGTLDSIARFDAMDAASTAQAFNFSTPYLLYNTQSIPLQTNLRLDAVGYQSTWVQIRHTASAEQCLSTTALRAGVQHLDLYLLCAFNRTAESTVADRVTPFAAPDWQTVACFRLLSPVFAVILVLGVTVTSLAAYWMVDPSHTNLYLALSEGYEAILGTFRCLLECSEYQVVLHKGFHSIVLRPANRACVAGYRSFKEARGAVREIIQQEERKLWLFEGEAGTPSFEGGSGKKSSAGYEMGKFGRLRSLKHGRRYSEVARSSTATVGSE
ncbi:hypothetical protein BC830DRAFT_1174501 [Chytriomyces sp. MP71]|nr:hypothetical protein BC830DRAFT_1174501 [Chytriomyces sp. MP71]